MEASAINATTIRVKFSNGDVENFTVKELTEGENTVEFEYKGQKFTEKVNFTAPVEPVDKAEVEEVIFDNYRQFRVVFNTVVDEETATDPRNYYFEIVESKPDKLAVEMKEDLNLMSIDDSAFPGAPETTTAYKRFANAYPALAGNAGWYWYNNIIAETIEGKTVVTIRMPELARFDGGKLEIKEGTIEKKLDKDMTVNVAVRNVRDKDEVRIIDTAVFPMFIEDKVEPKLDKVYKYDNTVKKSGDLVPVEVDINKTIEVEATSTTKQLDLEFSEPIEKKEVNNKDVVKVYVNGVEVQDALVYATPKDATLSYDDAKIVGFDLEKAVVAANFKASDKLYNVKIVGIRDYADNIMVPSTITFNFKLINDKTKTPEAVKPIVKDIVQIADNLFKVEWNRANATGKLTIKTIDDKITEVEDEPVSLSRPEFDNDGNFVGFFSYVAVGATDDARPDSPADKTIYYAGQKDINRNITIDSIVGYTLDEDNKATKDAENKEAYNKKGMELVKDELAPEHAFSYITTDLYGVKGYTDDIGSEITMIMTDNVPFDPQALDEVMLMTYGGTPAPLNVKVSYEKDGIIRTADVEVKDTNFKNNALTIDLNDVIIGADVKLLDKDDNLVEGATYTIEVPKGMFADPKKDAEVPFGSEYGFDSDGEYTGKFDFAPATDGDVPTEEELKGMYVDAKREDENGFTSLAFTVEIEVPNKVEEKVEEDEVPQTSKPLIEVKDNALGKQEIHVRFIGSVDPETLRNPENYVLNGKTLADWEMTKEDIKYVIDGEKEEESNKYAVFTVPEGSVPVTGDVAFIIRDVANKNGAKMTPVDTKITLKDNTAPEILEAKKDGSQKIILTFDEPVILKDGETAATAGKNFKVMVGNVEKLVNEVKIDGTAVTLVLEGDMPEGEITVSTVLNHNGDMLIEDLVGNKLAEGIEIKVER
ncbi:SwmB domain-containing protein [Anaerosalibacter sp. Marseille-P3206]|uniref:SwmB domain-containing protein n=1 Tax=Anaerosalibacter sp. Marseille-P3206 TaxID=1871005 RepID=UPI000987491B|nr:SwmB domain-containing protein [Anaerosalibacter sp. Marseille-P3206]